MNAKSRSQVLRLALDAFDRAVGRHGTTRLPVHCPFAISFWGERVAQCWSSAVDELAKRRNRKKKKRRPSRSLSALASSPRIRPTLHAARRPTLARARLCIDVDEALDHRNPVKIREREDARVRIRHCTAVDFHCLKHCCCTVSEGLPFPTIATVYPAKRNAEPCMITVPRK